MANRKFKLDEVYYSVDGRSGWITESKVVAGEFIVLEYWFDSKVNEHWFHSVESFFFLRDAEEELEEWLGEVISEVTP